VNRTDVKNFFKILKEILFQSDLLNKPQNISNMDETGFSVINEPGKVITEEGTKMLIMSHVQERGMCSHCWCLQC
jgi:hypothetical protein